MNKRLRDVDAWCAERTRKLGFNAFPIQWEVVPESVLLDIASRGLPTRASHWSYGQSYKYQKITHEMGMSKIYELILNNRPSYAFLLDSNPDYVNSFIIAHCWGHSAYFCENFLFKKTDRQMVYHAAERATRIDNYIEKYGLDRVEKVMDVALSMERNINWHRGVHRDKYPPRKKVLRKRKIGEFEDLLGSDEPEYREVIINNNFPPSPEYDLLWFFTNYSPKLENWEKDVFQIIREESFYFFPQYVTKSANEGLACMFHTDFMAEMPKSLVSPAEYIEFLKIHEKVVQPGADPFTINPYYLGFNILSDVKKKAEERNEDGWAAVRKVISEEDDITMMERYLTQELCDDMKMFTYIKKHDPQRNEYIEVTSKKAKDIVRSQVERLYNYRSPLIAVTAATPIGLELEHMSKDIGTLDLKHIIKVMEYLYEAWGSVVDLRTYDSKGEPHHFTYDEAGFSGPQKKIEKGERR